MSLEIKVVDDKLQTHRDGDPASPMAGSGPKDGTGNGEESLLNDVHTTAAYKDLEHLQMLVECEGSSVLEPDGLGYYALQWAALNNWT
ncbi:hypothetical protein TorRG33x02_278180 [Trema orientale]|uniref:Ankyrin repeat-containing domain containing protein n=1 Tax=Trema orientale TaxID=63057 RepID=A0A2P5CP53_TREOI|nr:hypothetical protein TorRG33x02_278180 [Trema orientale]